MSTSYLGQIQLFAFDFAPKGWALCNGATLPIAQNQALFALLGIQYGGNGQTTFNLPDLQGRTALGFSNAYVQGAIGGEAAHALTVNELPAHTHSLLSSSADGTVSSPVATYPAVTARTPYAASSSPVLLNSSSTGNGAGHSNQSPFLVLNFCIALQGIFPTRS